MKILQAIPTKYKGVDMRSKLEATWAEFFDFLKIEWIYEPEGYKFKDKTMYLPDFWLLEQNLYFECKGVMTDNDMHKIKMLSNESGKSVVVGYTGLKFQIYEQNHLFNIGETRLIKCKECNKWCFISDPLSWQCKNCGAYDGNAHVIDECFGNEVYCDYIKLGNEFDMQRGIFNAKSQQ